VGFTERVVVFSVATPVRPFGTTDCGVPSAAPPSKNWTVPVKEPPAVVPPEMVAVRLRDAPAFAVLVVEVTAVVVVICETVSIRGVELLGALSVSPG
jgi:hypothetical protein